MEQARQAFRVRSKMIKSVKMNFKNDLKCEKCADEDETQEQVMMCKEFWKDLNTDQIRDQVTFFHRFEKEKARMATKCRQ